MQYKIVPSIHNRNYILYRNEDPTKYENQWEYRGIFWFKWLAFFRMKNEIRFAKHLKRLAIKRHGKSDLYNVGENGEIQHSIQT